MSKTYYKVVIIDKNGEFRSSNTWLNNDYVCTYELNVTTFPKIGKLFVFSSVPAAKQYIKNHIMCESSCILEVEAEVSTINQDLHILNTFEVTDKENIINFWTGIEIKNVRTLATPTGSILVDSITPRKIYETID